MLNWIHSKLSKIFGKNSLNTPKTVILDQMSESRLLPTGRAEFDEWSDRIISGSLLPATPESQKFALASMICQLPAHESHKPDGWFISCLRKSAATQVAQTVMREMQEVSRARAKAEEDKKALIEAPQK